MDGGTRLVQIALALVLLGAAIVGRLAVLQFGQHAFWEHEAVVARTHATSLPFRRGSILDARGREVATTRTTDDLDFDFWRFRRGAATGQLLLARFLLTGERVAAADVLARPEAALAPFSALTVGELAHLEPGARRADLLAYAAWLVGDADSKELVARLRSAAAGELAVPKLAQRADEVVARVRAEAATLRQLERDLELERGELVERIDEAIKRNDARVVKLLARRDRRKPYEAERELHKELDRRTTTLARNVPHAAVFELAADPARLPGLVVAERARRVYPNENELLPLVVGRVGVPSETMLKRFHDLRDELDELSLDPEPTVEEAQRAHELDETLRTFAVNPDEEVGSEGLERTFEPLLRGRRGFERSESDRTGETRDVVERVDPLAGLDVQLTVDAELERAAEAVLARGVPRERNGPLERYPGAFVLLELPTGEPGGVALDEPPKVRALASWPAPSRAQVAKSYDELAKDTQLRPLHPRAWKPAYPPPPGSSIKPLVAAVALTAGLITPTTTLLCNKSNLVAPDGGKPVKCEGDHGQCDLREALVKSCNHYFAQVALRAKSERMVAWLHDFGFGERTRFTSAALADGTTIPGLVDEARGTAEREPGGRNLMLLGMGQGKVDGTPLQVAAAMGALATRRFAPPTLIERVGDERPLRAAPRDLPIDPAAWNAVVDAMRGVTHEGGTASPSHLVDLSSFDLATKTGTPQQAGGEDHSWFVGFFPSRAPRYAFAIFLERTGRHGGDAAAPILFSILTDPAFAAIAATARAPDAVSSPRASASKQPEGGP